MSHFSEYRYIIVPFSDITDQMASDSVEGSKDYLRHSVAGEDRCVLKYYVGSKPSSMTGIDSYTHSQILAILEDESGDWFNPDSVFELPSV
jgi:hypothetical protein